MLYNLKRCYTATIGTGTLTIGAAILNDFSDIPDGTTVSYSIIQGSLSAGFDAEVGRGTYSAGTLARDTVLSSTNGGAKIALDGTAQVVVTALAEDFVSFSGGVAGQVAAWSDANTITAGALIPPASNILTLTNAAASTLALNIGSGKALTLTAADNYTLTVPATGTAALLATANVFTAQQEVDVATTSTLGLILKTTDNNTTNSLFEVQSSAAVKLVKISPVGKVSIANATAAHVGAAWLNVNDNSGATDLLDIRYATTRVLYVSNTGALTIAPQVPNASQKMITISPAAINPSGATVTWWGHDESISWTSIPAGIKALYAMRFVSTINSTSLSTTSLNAYVMDFDMVTGAAFTSSMGTYTGFRVYTELSGSSTITNLVFFDVGTKVSPKTNTVTNAYGFIIRDIDYGATLNYAFRTNKGLVTLGDQTAITGWQDLTQFQVTGHTTQTNPVAHLIDNTAATNAVRNVLKLETQSTGTAANGIGAGLLFTVETATAGTIQNAGRVYTVTVDATNASRKYALVGTAFDTAEREGWRVEADGSAAKIGLYGVATVARATTAGTASTFAANTSGIVDDTATFDNYTIGQVVKALRDIGILT